MNRSFFVIALITSALLSFPVGCGARSEPRPDGGASGGEGGAYTGPTASPYCGSVAYDDACRAALPDGIPYCYAPAHHGDVGPAPFHACVIVLGGDAPPVVQSGDWASWWCCPFHNEGDGGIVVLDGSVADSGGTGGIGT